jgi:hypothetical protein
LRLFLNDPKNISVSFSPPIFRLNATEAETSWAEKEAFHSPEMLSEAALLNECAEFSGFAFLVASYFSILPSVTYSPLIFSSFNSPLKEIDSCLAKFAVKLNLQSFKVPLLIVPTPLCPDSTTPVSFSPSSLKFNLKAAFAPTASIYRKVSKDH